MLPPPIQLLSEPLVTLADGSVHHASVRDVLAPRVHTQLNVAQESFRVLAPATDEPDMVHIFLTVLAAAHTVDPVDAVA